MYPREEEFTDVSVLVPELVEMHAQPYDFETHDIHATSVGLTPGSVEGARNAAMDDRSRSHRGFKVGARAVAYSLDPENPRIAIYTSGNYKIKVREEEREEVDVEDVPKNCAEMDIVMRAALDDMERIGVFVVAATTRADRIKAVTDLAGSTLEPCEECEKVMRHSDLVDDQTIIMTVGTGDDIYQVQNFKNLKARYRLLREGKTPPPLPTYRYSPLLWEDRQRRYVRERDAAGLSPNASGRSKRDERVCRELALAAMTPRR